MSAELTLHVAIIEWDESVSPTSYVGLTIEDVDRQVRAAIEHEYSDGGAGSDEIAEFVNGLGKEIENYDDWHEILHEFDGTPWVTREAHAIAAPRVASTPDPKRTATDMRQAVASQASFNESQAAAQVANFDQAAAFYAEVAEDETRAIFLLAGLTMLALTVATPAELNESIDRFETGA